MTTDTTTAHDLLVLADPIPTPPTCDADDVARVVRQARATDVAAQPVTVRRPRRPPSRRGRLVLGVGAVAVAAAVASVAVGVLPQGGRIGVRTPAAAADPVAVLRAAAVTAAAEPFVVPRPDQFLYYDDGGGYRHWTSVDGTHDGRSDSPAGSQPDPGCRDGVQLAPGNYVGVRPQPCTPMPGYVDVPTDPTALRTWLVTAAGGPETNSVAKEVLYLLGQTLVSPAGRAALFEVVSTYDGLAVSTDGLPAGEVAVTWDFGGGTNSLYFAADDHRYLGVHAGAGGSDSVAPVVVDAVGQTG